MDLDRIDANSSDLVELNQPNQVRCVSAAGIENIVSGLEVFAGNVVERIRPARVKALVQKLVDTPCFLAVDTIELLAITA